MKRGRRQPEPRREITDEMLLRTAKGSATKHQHRLERQHRAAEVDQANKASEP